MHILLFHPAMLPPKDYGGTERVVLWLAKGLLERGHQVSIAALRGSQLPHGCHLLEVEKIKYTLSHYSQLIPKDIDIVHFMAPIEQEIWNKFPIPAILTVHGNGKPGETYPKNTVFLSQDHARRHGAKVYVYNGIDPDEYLFLPREKKEDWYFFLSKTNWSVKNLSGAISYCQMAKVPLKIAGGRRPILKRLRCIFSSQLDWIGPITGQKKADLLSRSRALLFPVLWDEPFGLVVVEALVSGTPVFANPRGSLTEILPPSVGLLLDTDRDWVKSL
jgi:glycosyltransferase involved in cell wall biosynthesis